MTWLAVAMLTNFYSPLSLNVFFFLLCFLFFYLSVRDFRESTRISTILSYIEIQGFLHGELKFCAILSNITRFGLN